MKEKKRILVVDDEPDYCALVRRLLEHAGFEVQVAYDGLECLEKVSAQPPDAIIMDIVMPEKDGRDVCRELKNNKAYCHIPIMMLSAACSHVSSTRYSRYRVGKDEADVFLTKPADAREIIENLKRLLRP